jgi:hypothetical protein
MPAFLLPFISMIVGHYGTQAGSALLRKLLAGGASSLTSKIASGATSAALANPVGQAAEKGLSAVAAKLPAWAAKQVGVAPLVENTVGLGSTAAKMGMFTGASMLANDALSMMDASGGGPRDDRGIGGWERYQGQMNPGESDQMRAILAIQDQAQQQHLERAVQELIATNRENANRMGGLF